MKDYEFLGKALFFPEQGILVIGDLHIGYEESLVESGILVPEQQVAEAVKDLEKIIQQIKDRGHSHLSRRHKTPFQLRMEREIQLQQGPGFPETIRAREEHNPYPRKP